MNSLFDKLEISNEFQIEKYICKDNLINRVHEFFNTRLPWGYFCHSFSELNFVQKFVRYLLILIQVIWLCLLSARNKKSLNNINANFPF